MRIEKYKSFIHYTTTNEEAVKEQLKGRKITFSTYDIIKVRVTTHALERWNERVGPNINKKELGGLINKLIGESNRVQLLNNNIGMIDDEIVFIYSVNRKKKKLSVKTFYGRISLLPYLANLEQLRIFNTKKGGVINLKVSKKELSLQEMPIIPKTVLRFKKNRKLIQLESYDIKNGEFILIYELDTFGVCRRHELRIQKDEEMEVPNQIKFIVDFYLKELKG